mmetsp:Transcript_31128/g.43144  ORF Transcript_31128/g.43144 Transcript_31128/m.43144 type:complete len:384 (-) Transcript_31128:370-1521(-)|eukprot:CAMPEP_0196572572 /NCGR_PEP_ID=MMETSP1081-20130531/2599_1 /TAXON_ID=36882 /ORGANISM="Pyramimonas amylifera, Strain CCMP720" /LENGTH=383 /DNA_ID=CAMNT_0041889933 /DNA_START=104 /DNA_END=1255 /DNA_ORIENTATION=+
MTNSIVNMAVLSIAGVLLGYVGFSAVRANRLTTCSISPQVELKIRHRTIKKEDVIIGCSSLAGMYKAIGEQKAVDTIKTALDAGFVDFDTAPHYGLGLSEERMGKGIQMFSNGRNIKIWTKVGRLMKDKSDVKNSDVIEEGNIPGTSSCIFVEADMNQRPVLDYTAKGVRQSYEDSSRRVGSPPIYGLRVHDADEKWRLDQVMHPTSGGISELVKLRQEGKIKDVSLGMNDPGAILAVLREFPPGTINSVMVAGCWNLLDQNGAELLLECQRRGIQVHNAGIFASGLLVGGSTYKYGAAPPEIIRKTEEWGKLAAKYAVPLPVIAMAFAFQPQVITKVAVGVKSPTEVKQNLAWLNATERIPRKLWSEAKERGLLADCVPLLE